MSSLDTVLQTIVPQRQILAGHGTKNEVDTQFQSGSGFDDVLAQSGAKDDSAEIKAEAGSAGPTAIFSKQSGAFHHLKIQLSDKAGLQGAAADPEGLKTVTEGQGRSAAEDGLNGDLANEVIKTNADDLGKTDSANLVSTRLKRKETSKLELLNIGNQTRSTEKNGSTDKGSVELVPDKIDVLQDPKLDASSPVGANTADDMASQIVTPDKTEKPVKTGRHAVDKKIETAKTTEVKADPAEAQTEGAKSLLDILGGDPMNNILNMPPQDTSPKSQKAPPTENPVASVLEAVSQPVVDQKIRHADHIDKRNASNEIQNVGKQTETDKDTLFRFSKADGSEKPVDLHFGTSDKQSDTPAPTPATMNRIENVVVLEARRYLALAPESNAFSLVSKIVGDKELSNAMTSSIIDPAKSSATSKVVNTLKLQMNPHDLGTVTATLRLRGEELSVAITVQNSAAYNHMTSDQDKMIDALRAQGFAVDQVTVQLISADRSSFQDQQGQSGNPGQQQQPRDGAAAQQGRQQGNGSPQDNSSSRSGQTNDMGIYAGTGVAGGDRTDGQVYI